MTNEAVLNAKVEELSRRISESEGDRRELWRNQGALDKEQAVIAETLKVLHKDLVEARQEVRALRLATWSAAISFTGLLITVLIVVQP